MSMDPISAREPNPLEGNEEQEAYEDQGRLAPMTEYPEAHEREHVLGGRDEGDDEAEEEDGEEARGMEVAPGTASLESTASSEAIGGGRLGETGGAAAEGANGYGSATDGVVDGGRDDVVIAPEQNTGFRTRWREIQAEFIEDPRRAAKDADELVAEITTVFAAQAEERRNRLTSSWQGEGTHGTEELRLVMRHYRGLVDHMLDQ